jgi:GT2 family glycosyltransferase
LATRPLDRSTTLGIVIVTWNSARFIVDCLSSTPAQYYPQTAVIDNHSNDNTAELVRTGFPDVRLIVNAENVGYAKANNQGILLSLRGGTAEEAISTKEQSSDSRSLAFTCGSIPGYLLLLNPDTKLPGHGIERMLAYLEANPKVGVLAPKLVNPDGTPQPSCRRFPTYRSLFFSLDREYKMGGFDFDRIQEVEQPMASCLLFRSEVLEQVGLFDEQFSMYFNDVDLSRRIHDAGWTTVYYPEVSVWHYRGGSTNQARPKMILSSHLGLFRYLRKYDKSGWFWLKGIPLAIIIELVALARVFAWRLRPVR